MGPLTSIGKPVIGRPRSITVIDCQNQGELSLTSRPTNPSVLIINCSAVMERALIRNFSATKETTVLTALTRVLAQLTKIPMQLLTVTRANVSCLIVSVLPMVPESLETL